MCVSVSFLQRARPAWELKWLIHSIPAVLAAQAECEHIHFDPQFPLFENHFCAASREETCSLSSLYIHYQLK